MSTGKKAASRSISLLNAYHSVFNTPQGTQVLYDLMLKCNMLNSTFSGDVHQMMIREGERNCVLRILTALKTDPKQILDRIEEHEREISR